MISTIGVHTIGINSNFEDHLASKGQLIEMVMEVVCLS